MSEVDVFITNDDDDELDQLLERVQLEEPDSDGGNSEDNSSSFIPSQVQLFAAVGSPTEEPRSGTSLALDEGSNGERRPEGGACQRPALSSTKTEAPALYKRYKKTRKKPKAQKIPKIYYKISGSKKTQLKTNGFKR